VGRVRGMGERGNKSHCNSYPVGGMGGEEDWILLGKGRKERTGNSHHSSRPAVLTTGEFHSLIGFKCSLGNCLRYEQLLCYEEIIHIAHPSPAHPALRTQATTLLDSILL
jgi:hypothetical protein